MTRKTCAAKGLLEFKMALNTAGAVIRIIFSGGYMGSNGVVSAKYTTDNPAIISLIESSRQFASKRIYLYSEEVVRDEGNEAPAPESDTTRYPDSGEINFDNEE